MANQHPKYGIPCFNRRDNSYEKRQWRLRKVHRNLLHARVHAPGSYIGWFQMAGYYRDEYYHNGLFIFYTYNKSCVRRWCNRLVRRKCNQLESRPNPAWYRKAVNYVNEVV